MEKKTGEACGIVENERWARYWARKYSWALDGRGDMDLEDLTQVAWLGILRARETYRPEAGSWAAYSACFIKRELMKALGIRRGVMPPRLMSLDAPLSEESEETRLDALEDAALPEPDAALLADELQTAVRQAVEGLKNPRQSLSVRRVELEGEALTAVAGELGVSVERARQLIRAAHRKLRQDRRLRALAECELETRYLVPLGVAAFLSTHTSAVERTVLWRLERQAQIDRAGADAQA